MVHEAFNGNEAKTPNFLYQICISTHKKWVGSQAME